MSTKAKEVLKSSGKPVSSDSADYLKALRVSYLFSVRNDFADQTNQFACNMFRYLSLFCLQLFLLLVSLLPDDLVLKVSAPGSFCLIQVRFAFCLRQFQPRIFKNSLGA